MVLKEKIEVEIADLERLVDIWGKTQFIIEAFIMDVRNANPMVEKDFRNIQYYCNVMLKLCGEAENIGKGEEEVFKTMRRIKIKGLDIHGLDDELEEMRKHLFWISTRNWAEAMGVCRKNKDGTWNLSDFKNKSQMWKLIEKHWYDMRGPKRKIEKAIGRLKELVADIGVFR